MNDYVLSEEEYEALDKVLTGSGLGDSLELQQTGTNSPTFPEGANDFFYDHEEDNTLTLKEGLDIIYDAAIDYKDCYEMSKKEIEVFRQLLIKMEVITAKQKLK